MHKQGGSFEVKNGKQVPINSAQREALNKKGADAHKEAESKSKEKAEKADGGDK